MAKSKSNARYIRIGQPDVCRPYYLINPHTRTRYLVLDLTGYMVPGTLYEVPVPGNMRR